MARQTRLLRNIYYILCEGATEYHYFSGLKQKITDPNIKIQIEDIGGGGYKNIISKISMIGKMGYFAVFVVFDGDKAAETPEEKIQLEKLVNHCRKQNQKRLFPCFLILNYPDFEYVACLHDPRYKGKDTSVHIKKVFGYQDVTNFKADSKIYEKLNTAPCSYDTMLKRLKENPHKIVHNIYSSSEKKITISSTEFNADSIGKNGSNLNEFFEILNRLS